MVTVALLPLLASNLTVRQVSEAPTSRSVYVSQGAWDDQGANPMQYLGDGERNLIDRVFPADPAGKYLERDRDLGQSFTAPATREPFVLSAITLRESSGQGCGGSAVSVQLFEVGGWPAAHDNLTRHQKVVAWTADPRADDYLTGESYRPIALFRGGRLPKGEDSPRWLRFEFSQAPVLWPGKCYAFLVMFDAPQPGRQLTLSSQYWGEYAGGHALRREGSENEGWNDPAWQAPGKEKFPRPSQARFAEPPTVWGRPDVDTWRDMCFYLEGFRSLGR